MVTLNPSDQEVIQRETDAAKAVSGSRLSVAKHLSQVREVLCRDWANPKQKHNWTLYLRVALPGLAVSRSQMFRDILSWRKAEETFPQLLLDEFLANGYALTVRPTIEQPLGTMTEECQHLLSKLHGEELNAVQYRGILSEAADRVKTKAKENRAPRVRKSADEKRSRILKDIHEAVISGLEDLVRAIEPGESYPARRVRDDLEEIVCRLMTATDVDDLELRQMSLPEGFEWLSLPDSAPDSSNDATSNAALAATAA